MMTLYGYVYQVLPFGWHRVDTGRNNCNIVERVCCYFYKFDMLPVKRALNLEELLAVDPQVVIDVGEPKSTIVEDLDALQEQTACLSFTSPPILTAWVTRIECLVSCSI